MYGAYLFISFPTIKMVSTNYNPSALLDSIVNVKKLRKSYDILPINGDIAVCPFFND